MDSWMVNVKKDFKTQSKEFRIVNTLDSFAHVKNQQCLGLIISYNQLKKFFVCFTNFLVLFRNESNT